MKTKKSGKVKAKDISAQKWPTYNGFPRGFRPKVKHPIKLNCGVTDQAYYVLPSGVEYMPCCSLGLVSIPARVLRKYYGR